MARKNPQPPRAIGRALNFAAGRTTALCQHLLDPHDLSLPQWVILSCLWREEDLTLGALADLVGTGLPAMSRIVDRMVDRGLVTREQSDADRRVIVVKPTGKANGLRHLSDFHQRINDLIFKGFSPEEQALAFSLLARMQLNAETALDEAQAAV